MSPRRRGSSGRRTGKRQRAWRFGRVAEQVCATCLLAKGYRVLAARHRNPFGEIDLIARRGAVVCFVEVKARENLTDAADAIGFRQRQRVARAAEAYLARHPELAGLSVRFDVMLVRPWSLPRHLTDAWRPE